MKTDKTKLKEYYEVLVQNAQKGESYLMKLKDNPIVYIAIPLIQYNFSTEDENTFVFNVLQPIEQKGVYKKSIEDIEMLVKKEI